MEQPFRNTMNYTLILQEGLQIAFVLHSASLWYFAFRASVPGKYQSVGFLFHAQINLITSKINYTCSMKREKNSLFASASCPNPCHVFLSRSFHHDIEEWKVERESWDNPLITSEVLKISWEGREREMMMRCGWVKIGAVLHLPAKKYHKQTQAEAFRSPCHVTGCLSRLQVVPIRYWLQLEISLCLFHFQIQRNNEYRSIICFFKIWFTKESISYSTRCPGPRRSGKVK